MDTESCSIELSARFPSNDKNRKEEKSFQNSIAKLQQQTTARKSNAPVKDETVASIQAEWLNNRFIASDHFVDKFDVLQIFSVVIKLLHKLTPG